MEETDAGKVSFNRYTPQYPLPEEIRNLKRDETVCQYCGISYLIHSEIKALEDKLKATENELEFYKGREDRESILTQEKEELVQQKYGLEEALLARDSTLANLKQELKKSTDANNVLADKIQALTENENKYRQQYMTALRQLSSFKSVVRMLKDELIVVKKKVKDFNESFAEQVLSAEQMVKDKCIDFQKGFDTVQSRLQCLEMEHMVTCQSNKALTDRLKQQDEKIKVLEHCEQERLTLDGRTKELQSCLKDVQVQLDEAVSRKRQLQLEAEEYQRQLRVKTEEAEEAVRQRQQQAKTSEAVIKEHYDSIQRKDKEITALQKKLMNLEDLHQQTKRRQEDITQQNMLTAHEAQELKESLLRARGDVEALKAEREMMISAHQSRIEDLRESFKKKMADQDHWPEKIQMAVTEEKQKREAQLASLEAKLKEGFLMELQIEKQKYNELLQKYKAERAEQKMSEMKEAEARHRREVQGLEQMLAETRRQAEIREAELRQEIESLKRIISELQDRLGQFHSLGEEKAEELQQRLEGLAAELKMSQDKAEVLDKSLRQSREEVQFLQDTVRKECEERFELTEALSEARKELLSLKKPAGGYPFSGTPRNSVSSVDSLASLKRSVSINSLASGAGSISDDISKPRPPPVPASNINVSYSGETLKSARHMVSGSISDNRRRIAVLLGKRTS